jgi:hypothetical protein
MATTMLPLPCSPQNIFDIPDLFHQNPILEEPIPPLENKSVGLQNAEVDAIFCSKFAAIINSIHAEVGLLKKKISSRESSSFLRYHSWYSLAQGCSVLGCC